MTAIPKRKGVALFCGVAMGLALATTSAWPQATDGTGRITSENFLILGPFAQGAGCGTQEQLYENYVAPARIWCEYPEDGDPIEYDAAVAASTAYEGPVDGDGNPVWRYFDDTSLTDGIHDLTLDPAATAGTDDRMSWLATYVEYTGAGPTEIDMCVGSDDGVQVFWDSNLVVSDNACRGRGDCDNLIQGIPVTPGVHRIVAGAWNRGGGWGLSIRLQVSGAWIQDGDPNWIFLGTDPAGIDIPSCPEILPERTITAAGNPDACPPGAGGPIFVTITDAGGDAGDTVEVVESVSGNVSAADITASDDATVVDEPSGWIRHWLLLGPYGQDLGANPGMVAMQGDYLTDGAGIDELTVQPVAGDTVATDYFPGVALSTALLQGTNLEINDGGVTPTWAAWEDTDETIDFNDYYGGDVDNIMMYAVVYVRFANPVDSLAIGLGSDDAVQVLFDDEEVWLNEVARGWGAAGEVQDYTVITDLIGTIDAGVHRVMVKIFEGGGGHGFRFQFMDPATGGPLTEGIEVGLTPDLASPLPFPDSAGARITWNVERSVLQGPGVSYEMDVGLGTYSMVGRVDGVGPFSPSSTTLAPAANDLGPFPGIGLEHGHEIGVTCAGADIVESGDLLSITAGGVDIWGTADQFAYAYKEVTGDFSARVTVANRILGNNTWAKHGLMARVSCNAGSSYALVADQNDAGLTMATGNAFQWRATQGAQAAWPGNSPIGANHVDTMRLDRVGNEFIGYAYDIDGTLPGSAGPDSWVELGRQVLVEAGPEIQIGLAVTSHDGCNLVTAEFEDFEIVTGTQGQPPGNVTCAEDGADLLVTWDNVGFDRGPNRILVNGEEKASLADDVGEYRIAFAELPEGQIAVTIANNVGENSCGYFTGTELHINCGGPALPGEITVSAGVVEVDIDDGRVWQADTAANPSPFLVTGATNTADFSADATAPIFNPGAVQLAVLDLVEDFGYTDNVDTLGDGEPDRSVLFATERWKDGDLTYRIPMPAGEYTVTLLFAEGCCSDGCEDIDDPALSATNCRVVDVLINGELVDDQFSQHVEAQRSIGGFLPNADWGVAIVREYEGIIHDGVLEITIDDLGGGNPPENASVKGISIVATGGPGGDEFRRGDADASGAVNITDGIYVLNFLFLGGPDPSCKDAADADDSGAINITDGIYILNFLFLGGPNPVDPGDKECGPDPTPEDALDCLSFEPCGTGV